MTRWLPMPGTQGVYEASDTGFIRDTETGEVLVPDSKECVWLSRLGTRISVARAVARVFIGPRPKGDRVVHLDGDRSNNQASNLAFGTCFMAVKTHCPYGHPYSGDNLRIDVKGGRLCKACARVKSREAARIRSGYYERRGEVPESLESLLLAALV